MKLQSLLMASLLVIASLLALSVGWTSHVAAGPDSPDRELISLSKVPNVELVDQHGQSGRFVEDFIGDRLAVLTFTFTSCTTVCPVLDGIFSRVQGDLGDRLGKDTVLLTVSIDPETDIPERLLAHAERLRARDGWSFLTGEKSVVDGLLKSMEAFVPDIQSHSPTVLVVDGERGVWTRLYGMPTPARIAELLESYDAARAQVATP